MTDDPRKLAEAYMQAKAERMAETGEDIELDELEDAWLAGYHAKEADFGRIIKQVRISLEEELRRMSAKF